MSIVRNIKRQNYVIPDALVHNTGVVTATFGTINYNVTLSGLTANTLYFLYIKGSTPALNFSIQVPSAYRASFPDAILVGALYADGSAVPVFGSFVNIEGAPNSNEMSGGLAKLSSSGGNLTKGTTTVDLSRWTRMGDKIRFVANYLQTSAGSGGSGNFYISVPTNITLIDTAWPSTAPGYSQARGSGYVTTSGDGRNCVCWNAGGGQVGLQYGNASNTLITLTTHPITNAGFGCAMEYVANVTGWSNTPLKDL